ncbi:ATP-grasp domain-containing protein [Candidatus Synchoanobacter obligatus]|uniref:ATP-grasp domain-containing protein n=1 Tax=Candidatus Synchoanobacter obligatus TaxID=2919597 RepID=A0ABT1L7H5_9GAMM|nr:hypothetical protein [Candidatus Synchoanobacter obligatus]MCP8352288.1 hypothetical protein [Candidatus Synchoanobacter obligatus]
MASLLVGVASDPVLQHFYQQRYVRQDKRILFINTNRINQDIQLSESGWQFPCGGQLLHEDVTAVYNRMLSYHEDNMMICYLNWLMDEYYPNVINRPKDTLTNFSKLWQLQKAKDLGFTVPQTQVYANHSIKSIRGCDYIYKSISSLRSIVDHVDGNRQHQVHEPVVFQKDQGRCNIRVHVLGGACFAQEIVSDSVDYRYDLNVRPATRFNLPSYLLRLCQRLAQEMNLYFSGIDFVLMKGEYYFLEINPSPGYSYYEKQMVGSPISQMLYRYLCQDG